MTGQVSTDEDTVIRELLDSDSDRVLDIYRRGLDTGDASFETAVPEWAIWKRKYHPFCRFVYEHDTMVQGWAALAPVSARDCYSGVAEVSVYVDPDYIGQGIGNALMEHLVPASEAAGMWTLYSSIFPENQATLKLHLRHDFREVGIRERIAQRNGRWRDTLVLERRSKNIGCD